MNTETDLYERRVGTTLRGKWTLERLLGVGGMAAVYVGVHKIGRRAAIKILHPEVAQNREVAARFEQEAHAVNSFRHPGTVEIIDVDVTENGIPFLVMELLDGETLEDRIQRQLIGVAETLRICDELLDVLASAHDHGIVHRDIKPDNLFLLRDGRIKVLDFGIARVRQGAPKPVYTQAGVAIGTLSYMPPEQVAGGEIDARADIFAVGCTLFRLVTGRSPHDGDTEFELMVKMAMEPAPSLASVAPALPRELCMVVDRALVFDRARRYPDARTMQQDVRAVRAGRLPPYASARLAAGDLPNPAGQPPGSVMPPPQRNSTAPLTPPPQRNSTVPLTPPPPIAPTAPLTAVPHAAHALMAMPASRATPPAHASSMRAPSSIAATAPMAVTTAPMAVTAEPAGWSGNSGRTPTLVEIDVAPGHRAVGHGSAPLGRAPRAGNKAIALIAIGGVIVALGIGVAIWWSRQSAPEDNAQAAEPPRPRPATTAPTAAVTAPPRPVPPGAPAPASPAPGVPAAPQPGNPQPGNPASAGSPPGQVTALPFPMPTLPPAPSLPPLPTLTLPPVTAPPPLPLPGPRPPRQR